MEHLREQFWLYHFNPLLCVFEDDLCVKLILNFSSLCCCSSGRVNEHNYVNNDMAVWEYSLLCSLDSDWRDNFVVAIFVELLCCFSFFSVWIIRSSFYYPHQSALYFSGFKECKSVVCWD